MKKTTLLYWLVILLSVRTYAQLNGTYTIGGIAPDYATLTDAVNDLTNTGISGPVNFQIRPGTYTEYLGINGPINGSSSVNTITFQSETADSTSVTIIQTGTEVLYLSDVAHLRFQDLSFYSTGYYISYLYQAENLQFTRVSFNGDLDNTYYGVYADGNFGGLQMQEVICTGSSSYSFYGYGSSEVSGLSIIQSTFSGNEGIRLENVQAPVFQNNQITTHDSYRNHLYLYECPGALIRQNTLELAQDGATGIYLYYSPEADIRENTLNINGNYATGIQVDYQSKNTNVTENVMNITGDDVTGINIYTGDVEVGNNQLAFSGSGGQGMYVGVYDGTLSLTRNHIYGLEDGTGIYISGLYGGSGGRSLIANNFIQTGGSSSYYGLNISDAAQLDILHNSIQQTGSDGYSAALYFSYGTGLQIINNILAAASGYAMIISNGDDVDVCDYNNLYSNGSALVNLNGSDHATLADWHSQGNFGQHSLSVDPQFASDSDLHTGQIALNAAALAGTSIGVDFDGDARSPAPDIGADEFTVAGLDAAISLLAPSLPLAPSTLDVKVSLSNAAMDPVTAVTIQWSVNGTPQPTVNWTGSLGENAAVEILLGAYTFEAGQTYDLQIVISEVNGGAAQLTTANDQINIPGAKTAMAGYYTIGGLDPDFSTISEAIDALYELGVADAVIFLLRSGAYAEPVYVEEPIAGVSETHSISFQSEAMDAASVSIVTDQSPVYLYEVSFFHFAHLTLECTDPYNYVFYSQTSGGISLDHCVLTGHPDRYYDVAHFDSFGNGLQITACTFQNGYQGISINPSGSTSGLQLIGNTISNVQTAFYAGNPLNSPVIQNNLISTSGGYNAIELYNTEGDLLISGNTIDHQPADGGAAIYVNYLQGAGTSGQIFNNFITVSGGDYARGIFGYEADQLSVLHNNIHIRAGGPNSSCLQMEYGSGSEVLNNILVNSGDGVALTEHYGAHTYDYNNLFTAGANLADLNYNTYADLPAWQGASGQGAHSISIDPLFVSAGDLHVQAAGLDGAAQAGTGVDADIDGETRDATTPDIGADEFERYPQDVALTALLAPQPPVALQLQEVQIELYNLGTEILTSLVVEWSVNGLPQATVYWSGSLAPGGILPLSLGNFDFSSGGDFLLQAAASAPNGLPDQKPENNGLQVTIQTALTGTYVVNNSGAGDFSSIAEAIEALHTRGAAGDVTFALAAGAYEEQISIGDFAGNELYRIAIRSQSGEHSSVLWQFLPSSSENYLLQLNGVQQLTIEGIHLKALNGSGYGTVIELQTIEELHLLDNRLEGLTAGSSEFRKSIIRHSGNFVNRLSLENNLLEQGSYGLYCANDYLDNGESVTITGNTFEEQYTAILINYMDQVQASDNTFSHSHSGNYQGLQLNTCGQATISGNYFSGNGIGTAVSLTSLSGSATVSKNAVYGFGVGIDYSNLPGGALIVNNFIQVGDSNQGAFGIRGGSSNGNISILHNSVLNVSSLQSINSAALTVYGAGAYDIRNNILASTGGALVLNLSTSSSYSSDHNDLYGTGSIWAIWANNFRYNLAEWQAASGLDAHSISVLPQFAGPADLHLNQAALNAAGTPAGVAEDIDGDPRDPATPDIGADEFGYATADILPLSLATAAGLCADEEVYLQINIKNQGASDATAFTVKILQDATVLADENVGAFLLAPGETATYTLQTALDLSVAGAYALQVVTELTGDGDAGNNTLAIPIQSLPLPLAAAGSDSPYCAGETINLTASGGNTYQWSGPNAFAASGAVQAIADALPAMSGRYNVTVTDANSCQSVATVEVVVNGSPVATAGNNGPLCTGEALELSADGGLAYQWNGPAGFSSTDQNPILNDITADGQGVYTVTITDANGCRAIAVTEVTVNTVAGSISQNGPLCAGEPLELQAGGGVSYQWSGPGGFSSTLASPVIAAVEEAAGGAYSVTISGANGCSQLLAAEVVVNSLPEAAVSPVAQVLCGGLEAELTASGGTAYLWSDGATSASITVSPMSSSTYTVTVTNAAGCAAGASATVTVENSAPYFAFTGNEGFTNSAVAPQQGSPYQSFRFEIDYFDADGDLPGPSFPRLLLDQNNNGSYADESDRIFVMTESDPTDTDVTDGKRYFYQTTGLPTGMQYRTAFLAQDAQGCGQQAFSPIDEPNVVDFADISIYANDIVFSDDNPDPGTSIDVSATLHNDSDFSADNFVVRLVNQYSGQVYPDITVAQLPPHSNTTLNWTITTPQEVSWNPMQVIIDFTDVIDEPNELDNQAIRPFINGEYDLPGTILVSPEVSPEVSISGSSYITLSGNAVYDGTAVALADPAVAGATLTFTLLETGQTFSTYTNGEGNFSYSFQPPLTPGLYHLRGSVTDFTLTGEFTAQFVIQPAPCRPDLSCTFEMSASSVQLGGSLGGSIRVRNNGCATSGISTLLDLSGHLGSPVPADVIVPALAPGESFLYAFPDPVGFNTVGTAFLQAYTDAGLSVVESSEQNNTCSAAIRVNPDLPDIRIAYISGGGQRYQCQENGFTVKLENIGGVGTGSFEVERRIRRLTDDAVEYSDVVTIGNIGVGNYTYTSFSHLFEQTGDYQVEIFADIPTDPLTGVVEELNETNNTATQGLQLINCRPDLRLSGSLSVTPVDPHLSSEIQVTAQLENAGTTTVTDDVVVSFQIGALTVQKIHSGGLPVGQVVPVSAILPSPGGACADVFIHADPANQIAEVSEANNTQQSRLTYDFFLGNYCSFTALKFWQKPQKVNQPVRFDVGLYNTGSFTASSVPVKFEISGPGISGWLDWGAVSLANVGRTFSCPYVIGANTEYVFSQTGVYSVRMTVDPDGQYAECDEGNNVLTVSVTVVEDKPDLRILSQYIAPSRLNPDVGEPVSFSISYDNTGKNNIGDLFKLRWEVDEIVQDEVDAIGLNQGDSWTLAMPSSWSSTVPGIHIVRATIDSQDAIEENDELNNAATRAILVGQYPNLRFDQVAVSDPAPAQGDVIGLDFDILNEGDLACEATVQLFYTNDFSEEIPFETFAVEIAANSSRHFSRNWQVSDPSTALVLRIVNAAPEEYNATDNEAQLQLGELSVSAALTAQVSCVGEADGVAQVLVSGGQAPYLIQWSDNSTGPVLNAAAGVYHVSVTDQAGYSATASVDITVAEDTEEPLIFNGPADIVLNITDGTCPVPVSWTAPEAADNCSLGSFSSSHQPGDLFTGGATTVTYTAVDAAGNERTYSFDVIINAQPIAQAGDDQLICGPEATLQALAPDFGTGQWSVLEGSADLADPTDPHTLVSDLAPGLNRLQWRVTNGSCGSAVDEVSIVTDPGAFPLDGSHFAPPIPAIPDADLSANWEITDAGGWTHYYRCGEDGSTGHLLLSLYKDGQDIGEIGNGLQVRNVTTSGYGGPTAHDLSLADYVQTEAWFVFGRYWDVDTEQELSGPMRVRYYYSPADIQALKNTIEANGGLWNGDEAMRFFKVTGEGVTPFDLDVLGAGGAYREYVNGESPSLTTWTKGSYQGLVYAEYYVSSFSGGGGGGSPSPEGLLGALPLELVNFSARRLDENRAELQWITLNEEAVEGFYIQRTTDGRQWQTVGFLPSQGDQTEAQYYRFTDEAAPAGETYYRLEMRDLDGAFTYSPVKIIEAVAAATELKLFPNPTAGSFRLALRGAAPATREIRVRLWDAIGRPVFERSYEPSSAAWSTEIDVLEGLPAGVYTLWAGAGEATLGLIRVVKE